MRKKYVAKLISISEVSDLPAEFKYSVGFKALSEKRELKMDETVVIFNIENSDNFFPIFLDPGKTIEAIEQEVKEAACAIINYDSKMAISRFQEHRSPIKSIQEETIPKMERGLLGEQV